MGLETLITLLDKSKNLFMIVAPESGKFESNILLLNRIKEIQKLKLRMKIGLFFHTLFLMKIQITIFSVMNCSFIVFENNFTDVSESLENEIYIFPSLFVQTNPWYLSMYPMHIEIQIVVPEALTYSKFSTYLQTITTDIFFIYSLLQSLL